MTSVVFMVLCESTVKIFTSLKQFLTDFSHIFYDYDQTDLQIKYMSCFWLWTHYHVSYIRIYAKTFLLYQEAVKLYLL